MPEPKGARSAHAQRIEHANSGPGLSGRPSYLDDARKLRKVLEFAAQGLPASFVSKAMGWAPNTINHWLNMGEAAVEAGLEDDKYARFYQSWWWVKASFKGAVLERLRDSEELRYAVEWVRRTDEDFDFYDRDRVVGRSITVNNVPVSDLKNRLQEAKERKRLASGSGTGTVSGEEGAVVEGQYREVQ